MTFWHPALKLLHWTMALMLLAMVAAGLLMTRAADLAAATGDYSARVLGLTIFDAYQLHKSIGVVLFTLVLGRLFVRWRTVAPSLPTHMPPIERFAAKGAHVALYALMLSLPLSGWLLASASPLGIPTLVFGVVALPHPIGPDAGAEAVLSGLHFAGGMALLALSGLHVAAALKHHLIDRDDVLRAMMPAWPRRKKSSGSSILILVAALALTGSEARADPVWIVQPEASTLGFSVSIGGAEARGAFQDWSAEIVFDPAAPEAGMVAVRVDIASVRIDAAQAQGAIAGAEWLDAIGHPVAVFEADGFVWQEDEPLTVPGVLTLRGVARPLTLTGPLTVEDGVATADLGATLLREEFNVGGENPAVSAEVVIHVTLIATRSD